MPCVSLAYLFSRLRRRFLMKNRKRFLVSTLVLAGLATAGLAFVSTRSTSPMVNSTRAKVNPPPAIPSRSRNLSLQPEAFAMSRRLGQRFSSRNRHQTIISGTLRIGTDQRVISVLRRQTDDGERLEIAFIGSPALLTWSAADGPLSSGAAATGSDRELIERLVLDSPDQFVLAQLRGASYFTVARNVRPANAGDSYNGPLWNIVRVNDPNVDEIRRPHSRWRLYYLNATTGLIDRIESELHGQRLVAEISGWTDVNGEKVPTQITWTREGQILMQYRWTSFSVTEM